jgi:hypothetical protein
MSLNTRLRKLEAVAPPELSEEDRQWLAAFDRLLSTMSTEHAEIVLTEIHNATEDQGNLTHAVLTMINQRVPPGRRINAYALPPGVAQIYLDDAGATLGAFDCADCGYAVPYVKSTRRASRVFMSGAEYAPTVMNSPDSVYFGECPLCGGHVDDFAWLAGRCYQDRIEEAQACGRGCDLYDHFTFCMTAKVN